MPSIDLTSNQNVGYLVEVEERHNDNIISNLQIPFSINTNTLLLPEKVQYELKTHNALAELLLNKVSLNSLNNNSFIALNDDEATGNAISPLIGPALA